ncbi:MAG: DegT/DnrJ/EryC1/StrS family aminotransferase [Candidatus Helarchaeota archaeon]
MQSPPEIGQEEIDAVINVLKSKKLTLLEGNVTKTFEEEFAEFCGAKHAIATNSGTAAIHVVLAAVGIGPGDEVIVPPFTFVGTVSPVLMQGAQPVFADVDSDTYNIDPEDVKRKITSKTKAIIPVHLFGQSADMKPLLELAAARDIFVIEDACQSHGSEYDGKKVGTMGIAGCFSFYPSKNMTTGEGGMIVTNDAELAAQCRLIRHHGEPEWYRYVRLGYNYRMTEIQAALGRVQLKKLTMMNEKRSALARTYDESFLDLKGLQIPKTLSNVKHVYNIYAPKLNLTEIGISKEKFLEHVNADVPITKFIYPSPLYKEPLFDGIYKGEPCPNVELLCTEIIKLPLWPSMPDTTQQMVIDKVRNVLGS